MRGTTAPAAPSLLMLRTCQSEAPKYVNMVGDEMSACYCKCSKTVTQWSSHRHLNEEEMKELYNYSPFEYWKNKF